MPNGKNIFTPVDSPNIERRTKELEMYVERISKRIDYLEDQALACVGKEG